MNDSAALAAAARFERDRRGETYPAKIRDGKIPEEAAAIDYQCWVAIAEWLETDRFFSFVGGADPDKPDAPLINWPELEAASASALATVEALVERQEAKALGNLDDLTEIYVRRAKLICIHRKVQLRRQSIDAINHQLQHASREGITACRR